MTLMDLVLAVRGLKGDTMGSEKPLEPRKGEPRQPNKALQGLLGAIGPYLIGETWLPFPRFSWLIWSD